MKITVESIAVGGRLLSNPACDEPPRTRRGTAASHQSLGLDQQHQDHDDERPGRLPCRSALQEAELPQFAKEHVGELLDDSDDEPAFQEVEREARVENREVLRDDDVQVGDLRQEDDADDVLEYQGDADRGYEGCNLAASFQATENGKFEQHAEHRNGEHGEEE